MGIGIVCVTYRLISIVVIQPPPFNAQAHVRPPTQRNAGVALGTSSSVIAACYFAIAFAGYW